MPPPQPPPLLSTFHLMCTFWAAHQVELGNNYKILHKNGMSSRPGVIALCHSQVIEQFEELSSIPDDTSATPASNAPSHKR